MSRVYTWIDSVKYVSKWFVPCIKDIDFANYADDNPIDATGKSIDDLTLSFQEPSKRLLKSFANNQMNCNSDKCRLH